MADLKQLRAKRQRNQGTPVPSVTERLLGGTQASQQDVQTLPVEMLTPSIFQPRGPIDEDSEGIQMLAESIQQHGLLEPVLVLPAQDGKYPIVSGERRWRAHRRAKLGTIKAFVLTAEQSPSTEQERVDLDRRYYAIAMVANIHRENLSHWETGRAIAAMKERGATLEEIASQLGWDKTKVSRHHATALLPAAVIDVLQRTEVGQRTVYEVTKLATEEEQLRLAEQIIRDELTQRQVEQIVKSWYNAESEQPKNGKQQTQKYQSAKTVTKRVETAILSVGEIENCSEEDFKALVKLKETLGEHLEALSKKMIMGVDG